MMRQICLLKSGGFFACISLYQIVKYGAIVAYTQLFSGDVTTMTAVNAKQRREKFMKNKMKKLLGIILSLVLVLGLMPGMSMTAYAAEYTSLSVGDVIKVGDSFTLSDNIIEVATGGGNAYMVIAEYNDYPLTLVRANVVEVTDVEGGTTSTVTESETGGYYVFRYRGNRYVTNTEWVVSGKTDGLVLDSIGTYQYYARTDPLYTFSVHEATVAVTGVSLNKTTTTLTVGDTETLTATVSPDGATDKTVTWSSSDTDVATVENGVVTAVGSGTANITVTATNGTDDTSDDKTATCAVTVETETVATPIFSPEAGTYTEAQSVTITCATEGATIHYTTDGSAPTASSTPYSNAISVSETATIKAIAVKEGMTNSSIASATYTINITPETVATPVFNPAAGTYTEAQTVTISCATEGATIHYTTDGSTPTASSTPYSNAISVSETATIKAIAVKAGMADSAVTSATYTISEGPEPSEKTMVNVDDLSDNSISNDLKNSEFNSVSKIEDALETALSITTEEEKERSKLVDVKLMISTDGGINWDEATVLNFPAGGIDVVLPYPDGTNGDEYSFSVAHMIGTSANGKNAGEIEKPGTTNTSSGISTHFNGLSPVMITWTKNSSPSKKTDSKEEKQHTHHYVWETIEATENSDGELRYKCDICGDIQTRVPITAYYVFNKNTSEKIKKAGQGATVKIETSRWISFHKMVMQALADRPDVSLEVSFLDGEYKGNRVSFTIPAGTDTLSLLDENGFSGFLYLAGKFGTAN